MRKHFSFLYVGILAAVVSLILLEIIIRFYVYSDYVPVKKLKAPGLYGSWCSDDDYWRLYHLFGGEYSPPPSVSIHPFLGWSQREVSINNPLGLKKDSLMEKVRSL